VVSIGVGWGGVRRGLVVPRGYLYDCRGHSWGGIRDGVTRTVCASKCSHEKVDEARDLSADHSTSYLLPPA
jgi:hypothetical protein